MYHVLLIKHPTLNDVRHWLRINHCAYSKKFNFFQRSEVFLQNHRFVCQYLGVQFLDNSRGGCSELWSQKFNDNTLSIKLTTPSSFHRYEGELILAFECNARRLMVLSFMFCDGVAMGIQGPVAFVTRIQGVPGQQVMYKEACKLLSDMNLSHPLISALDGLCLIWGIKYIVGLSIENQPAYLGEQDSPNFASTYTGFWLKNHATMNNFGYYQLRLPLLPDDMPLPTGSHRARTMKHRQLRRKIADDVGKYFM